MIGTKMSVQEVASRPNLETSRIANPAVGSCLCRRLVLDPDSARAKKKALNRVNSRVQLLSSLQRSKAHR